MITSPSMFLEPKGVDAVQVKSCARVLFTSNEEWVVPASDDERRFFVLDVSDARRRDTAYFGALMEECKNGGAGRLLHELLTLDLAGFDVRTAPRTEALGEQVINSLPPEAAWLREVLHRGYITNRQRSFGDGEHGRSIVDHDEEWLPEVRGSLLWDEAQEYARGRRWGNFPTELNVLVRKIKPYLPKGFGVGRRLLMPPPKGDKTDPLTSGKRVRVYNMPELAECRRSFALKVGCKIDWPAEDGGAPGPPP
jgi:hypothetical protein